MAVKPLIAKLAASSGLVGWLLVGGSIALTGAYFVGKHHGRNEVREQSAQKQAEVTQQQLRQQLDDRTALTNTERQLNAEKNQYDDIINNHPELQDWNDIPTPDCAAALSAGPGMHDDHRCAMPARQEPHNPARD